MSFKCNYLLSTGDPSLINCRGLLRAKNKKSTVVDGFSFVSSDISTGHFSLSVSLDGLTLFEEYPIKTVINGKNFFDIDSGDFYMLHDEGTKNLLYFNSVENNSEFIYDQKNYDSGAITLKEITGIGIWENSTIPELTGQIAESPPLDTNDLFDRWNVFFNRKKINIEDSNEIDEITGVAFIYKKDSNAVEIKTNDFDIYGTGVLPNQSDFYVNGLKKNKETFIEMNTGIKMIKIGVESIKEFQEDIETRFSL